MRKIDLVKLGGVSRLSISFGPKVRARWPSSSISASLLSTFEMFALLWIIEKTSRTVLGPRFFEIICCASLMPWSAAPTKSRVSSPSSLISAWLNSSRSLKNSLSSALFSCTL